MRLLIQCEGDTEKEIRKSFLAYFWKPTFDSAEVVKYDGNGELARQFRRDALDYLRTEPDGYVVCLVDLYEEPFQLYKAGGKMSPAEGFQAVRDHMAEQIEPKYRHRFGAFPVVMEIETWLIADHTALNSKIPAQTHPNPESIVHLADHLQKLYTSRKKTYSKLLDGRTLFRNASAKRVYDDNCPHFKLLADWLSAPPTRSVAVDPSIELRLNEWQTELDRRQAAVDQKAKEIEDPLNSSSHQDLDDLMELERRLNEHLQTHHQIYRSDQD